MDVELPSFDPASAPAEPLPLFTEWFADAVAAGQSEPHTMSLATANGTGCPTSGSRSCSARTRTAGPSRAMSPARAASWPRRPYAALGFYWPAQGRQIRLRGPVEVAPAEEGQADLRAHSTGALAAALVGGQSEVLGSVAELRRVSDEAWDRARREPDAPRRGPSTASGRKRWRTLQGDARRRHVRLVYRRTEPSPEGGGWRKELLWP